MSCSSDSETDCVVCYELAEFNTHACFKCHKLICGKCIKKKTIQEACPHCTEKLGIRPNPTIEHLIACKKIRCPNKCGKKVRRRSVENHIKYCKPKIIDA